MSCKIQILLENLAILLKCNFFQAFTISNRVVCRTLPNIYDEAFLRKWLPTERRWTFSQKNPSLMFERILSRALGKSTTNNDNVSASINNNTNTSENKNELLSIVFDSNFSFEDHIKNIWKSKSKTLHIKTLLHICL